MGRERRKWTPDEDGILREAVEQAERISRPVEWQTVAKKLPGRTNKDCRKRWHNSLAETGNEGVWSASEDERLKNAVQIHGTKWAKVSSEVRTRNGDQCSKRWSHSVNPSLDRSQWTPEEDQALLNLIDHYGHNWQAIVSQHLPHRSALSAKNRHFLLNRKSNSKSVSKSPSRKDKTSQRPSSISLTASSGNVSNWVASSSPSAQTTTYATPTTRSLPFYSSPTQVGAIPTSSPPLYSDPPLGYGSPSTFGTGTHLPSNLDLHGRFFNSPDLLSPSYSPRAPSLRTPPFNTVGSSSLSPDPVLPSYTGSFAQPSSYPLSSQSSTYPFPTVSSNASSNEMYYSYLHSTSSAAPYSAAANAYTTSSSTYPGAIAYTSPHTTYSWPNVHQDEINAGNFINDDEAEEDEDEEGGADSSEGLEESDPEGVQRIWVEAECERGQVESLMQSVQTYSRSATFMPRPGQ